MEKTDRGVRRLHRVSVRSVEDAYVSRAVGPLRRFSRLSEAGTSSEVGMAQYLRT